VLAATFLRDTPISFTSGLCLRSRWQSLRRCNWLRRGHSDVS